MTAHVQALGVVASLSETNGPVLHARHMARSGSRFSPSRLRLDPPGERALRARPARKVIASEPAHEQ